MSLGLWPTKLPMTWDSDIGVDHFDVPSLESFYTIPKEESGLGRLVWCSADLWLRTLVQDVSCMGHFDV